VHDLQEHYQLTEEEAQELVKEQILKHKGGGFRLFLCEKDFFSMLKDHPELQSKLIK